MNEPAKSGPAFEPARILVRGVNWLGDAVMTTPALLRLRRRFPAAHIALLTPRKLSDLWQHHNALNEVIPFDGEDGLRLVAARLRPGRFDLALILPNSPRSAMESWLARIPSRVGYARRWRRFFLTKAIPDRPGSVKMQKRSPAEIQQLINSPGSSDLQPNPPIPSSAHQIHEYLHLVGALGAAEDPLAPSLDVTSDEVNTVSTRFRLESDRAPVVGLNPGAEYGPAKRWPADHFAAAVRLVEQRISCTWVIFGGKGDVAVAKEIESLSGTGVSVRNLAGQTSLRELMALLKRCDLLVTNDTGPMHVAAALGTPVVVPFGSTSPELTGPGLPEDKRHALVRNKVPCAPCFLRECPIDLRCLRGIPPQWIADAIVQRLIAARAQ